MEIDSSSTLDVLHQAIQMAVDFDDDHLYEFYTARTPRSRDATRFTEEEAVWGNIFETTLERLFPLEKNKKLYYLFDYGDHWLFRISKSRKAAQQPVEGVRYPRLVDWLGHTPAQYGEDEGEEECAS